MISPRNIILSLVFYCILLSFSSLHLQLDLVRHHIHRNEGHSKDKRGKIEVIRNTQIRNLHDEDKVSNVHSFTMAPVISK